MVRPRSAPNRNFWLGVFNGVFINGADAFLHAGLVMAPFLAGLGAPAWAIGLIPALRVGGWFLPQLFVATRLAHVPYKLPIYRRTSTLRSIAFVLLTISIFFLDDRPALLAALTLLVVAIHSFAGGIGGVPFSDVTAKVVPHHRLGTFWALRNGIGGLLALGVGVVLRGLLDSDLPFPANFGVIFACGTLLGAAAYLSFALVREPPGKTMVKEPMVTTLQRLPRVLRDDAGFRRYLRVRFLALASLAAEPFYGIYAIDRLVAPPSALGTYVIVATIASIAINFAFRRAADRGRNVMVMRVSIGLLCVAPLLALLAPNHRTFALVFAFTAAGNSGLGIAAWNLLYALAPEAQRPLYVGVANSILALPSLAPVVVGLVLAALGYAGSFIVAAAIALVALAFTIRFGELSAMDRSAFEKSRG